MDGPLAAEKCDGKFPGIAFHNVTYALPMFANKALKEFIAKTSPELDKEMFHFVLSEDIVPSMLLLGKVYNELSPFVKKQLIAATIETYVTDENLKKVAKKT